jgi:hypothetical protein
MAEQLAFQQAGGDLIPTSPLQKHEMLIHLISIQEARDFIARNHSRLPYTQKGPWKFSFGAVWKNELVGAALWHNCSARGLPQDWIELRRMAISGLAPANTASFMLAKMCRWLRKNTNHSCAISYQDVSVHTGTIYKAAGWIPVSISKPRFRDRSKLRVNTSRKYRSDSNGQEPAASAKIRWQIGLRGQVFNSLSLEEILRAKLLVPTK